MRLQRHLVEQWLAILILGVVVFTSGCTSFSEYIHNGFKVGPNYTPPKAPVPYHWIDANDVRTSENPENLCRWWTVFNDPLLNHLVACAYQQNLSLKEAGLRILRQRALLGVTTGYLFPQSQTAFGSYNRSGAGDAFTDSWNFGFNLSWELDFWGRYRRAVAAAEDSLDAAIADYDGVLVTLLGDIASTYVQIRTDQERIKLLKSSVELQREVLQFIETRQRAGFRQTELDVDQATSSLKQTEAAIPSLEIDLRQAENRLCILLGIPAVDLQKMLGTGPIPTASPEVAICIPAELLRRRPDVRRAERLAAAQAEQIGIAQAALYPAFSINGTLGYAAVNFPDLFKSDAFFGNVGPSFNWSILNYGRLVNNIRVQDASFQELVVAYQRTVIQADREVEDGLVTFLRAQQRKKLLGVSVAAARRAVKIVVAQYQLGAVDFNRYAVIEQNLVSQQDAFAAAEGQIAQGLITVYRALGGGWELRQTGPDPEWLRPVPAEPRSAPTAEEVPAPLPVPAKVPEQPMAIPPLQDLPIPEIDVGK